MGKIFILGMGPGHKDYILPISIKKINECDVLIGGKRILREFCDINKELVYIDANLSKIVKYIKENKEEKKIALLLSGDTGFYSMLDYMKRFFKDDEMEVIPGITSYQYLMSKLKKSWHDSFVGSVHGRELDIVNIVKNNKRVVLLTDYKTSPSFIASLLLSAKLHNKRMIVGENLSYKNERIIYESLENVALMKDIGMAVVVIEDYE